MNPFAGLMAPMVDRPCIDRREKREPRAAVPQWPPRRDVPVIANPWKLTPMQCAVMNLRRQKVKKTAIARQLKINPKTVYTHLENVQQKMGVTTKKHAEELWDRWSREHQETNQ